MSGWEKMGRDRKMDETLEGKKGFFRLFCFCFAPRET